MSHRHATIVSNRPSIRLKANATGDGEPLVLLPGLGRAPTDVEPLADILVNEGYAVLLPLPRGIGTSTGPLEGITLHDLAGDVASLIEQWVSGPATIIGHAFGNRIARTLAADRPELVSAVVLLSSSGKVQPTDDIAEAIRLAQATDTPPDVRRIAVQQAWFAPGHDGTTWMGGWSQLVMTAYLAAAAATPIEDWWTAGSKPVLIVQGLCDVAAPVGNGRLLKQELGERATLVELPDIGHAMPVEDPRACARPILEFLRRQR